MSAGAVRLGPPRVFRPHPGLIAAAALALLYGGALVSLAAGAGEIRLRDLASPYILRILTSSLIQSALSTLLALTCGAVVALAMARLKRRAAARALRALLLTATVAPTIVIVLGVVTVYGRSGWLADALAALGAGERPSIYGLTGILIAHTVMNAPFAARVFHNALARVPPEHHRVAAMCALPPWRVFLQCDWPALRRDAPALAALVMLLCFTSFAVVLTLGGGPRYATLEVAIFEALRIEVDFARAALLSLLQIVLVGGLALVAARAADRSDAGHSLGDRAARADMSSRPLRLLDGAALIAFVIFIAPILLAPLSGLPMLARIADLDVARALATSLRVALPAAALSVALALLLATAAHRRTGRRSGLIDVVPLLGLAFPPFALAAGLYAPLRQFGDNAMLAMILVPLVNAAMALPFAYRLIEPAVGLSRLRYGRLAAHLDLGGLDRLRVVDWPMLRRPVAAAFAMALALSFGDFGVAALFSGQDFRTLPLLLHERMGAYRLDEAQAIALLMIAVAFLLALITERYADAQDR